MSDGSVVVDEERAAKKAKVAMTNSLDGRMLAVLDAVVAKTAVSEEQRKAQLAETALEQLRHYILFHGHCLEAFLYEAFVNTSSGAPPPELVDAIQDVGGLDAVISTYCSRDDYFSPASFKATLAEFRIEKLHSHLMHLRLDKWRRNSAQTRAGRTRRKELVKPLEAAMSQILPGKPPLQSSLSCRSLNLLAWKLLLPAADADVIMEE